MYEHIINYFVHLSSLAVKAKKYFVTSGCQANLSANFSALNATIYSHYALVYL